VRADTLRRVFLSEAAAYEPLALLRIGSAAVALGQALVVWRHRDMLLGEHGLVPWEITATYVDPWLPTLADVASAIAFTGLSASAVVAAMLLLHMAGALFMLVGLHTRAAVIFAWATYLPLHHSGFFFTYGIGDIVLVALFYSMFMPVGRAWAFDSRLRPRPPRAGGDAAWSVLVLRIHVSVMYLGAGVSKLVGVHWWDGEAIWRALSLPQFQQFDPTPLAAFPLVLQAAAIGVTFTQLLYPFVVWTRARVVIVVACELIHLGIAIFLGLWLFSAMMMVLNAAAFGESVWRALRRHQPAAGASAGATGS